MSLVFSSPSSVIHFPRLSRFKSHSSFYNQNLYVYTNSNPHFELHSKIPWRISLSMITTSLINYPPSKTRNLTSRYRVYPGNASYEEESIDFDLKKDNDEEYDTGSPWEGAIIYRRNPLISHLEYCTTLERLGLGKLSTDTSKSRASAMGLRVTKAVKDYPFGTPVQISVDVTRKKHKLRLDGIVKTVITLGCNRCGEPAAESVFSNFVLLLTEEPIEESDTINMGTIFREDKLETSTGITGEDDDEASIDLDDRLYFPAVEKEIDISKHIRDLVHVEITITAICDSKCKGLCLRCGTNLNISSCNCNKQETSEKSYGPLGNLRSQMQKK